MKLKNSHILLIVIAIFLLISIGSVCANDTASADDVVLADDGSNVVLANDAATTNTEKLIDTKVVSGNVQVSEKDKKILPIAVKDNESNPIEVSAKNLTVAEGSKTLKFNYNQSKITITDTLSTGKHNLTLSYLGNKVYNKSSTNIILSVYGDFKIEASSTVNVNQTNKAEVPIKITNGINEKTATANEFNVELSYKDGNNTKPINITNSGLKYENGKLIFTPQFVDNIISYNMTITYKGSDNKTLTHKGKLNRITKFKIIPLNTETCYHNGNFTFKVVDYDNTTQIIANKTISVSVKYNGTYVLWPTGSNRYSSSKTFTTDSKGIIRIPNYGFYTNFYISTNNDGPLGNYALTLTGTNGLSGSYEENVVIKEIPVKYTISNTGVITVTNQLTKKPAPEVYILVKFDKSDKKLFLFQTDKNGKAGIKTVGKHNIQVINADSRYTGSATAKTISNNKITAKCSAPKVTDYYKGVKLFTIKLTTSAKKPIYDAKLKLVVNGATQTVTTSADGQVRLLLNTLKPGTYKVTITSGDTKSFTIKKVSTKIVIKKAPAKLTPKKLTAKKGVSKNFKVTVKNTKTKKVIAGVKVKIKVYTGKKYKTFTKTTNKKGVANFNVKTLLKLKVGTHKVVVTSANKYVTAKAAKSTIKITK